MKNEDILKILEKDEISDDDKLVICDFIKNMKLENDEQKHVNPNVDVSVLSEIKQELDNVKAIITEIADKKAVTDEKDKAVLFELEERIPNEFKAFVPNLPPKERAEWIRKVIDNGLFSEKQKPEIGSEINNGNGVTQTQRVRAISQKDIANMSDEQYQEFKKSGKLDYLIRNNLIID